LEEETLELQEVAVYGKTEGQKQREKGFAINAIETKGIEFQSIQANDLLDRSAGVRIRQSGGLAGKSPLTIEYFSPEIIIQSGLISFTWFRHFWRFFFFYKNQCHLGHHPIVQS
jgi:hypothetical protein